jgi:glycosyltransferase involved in cell wall biosynthesis
MKLLVVMRYFPWPPRTGSALVAYNTIRELSERHSISLVCVEKPAEGEELLRLLDEVHFPDGAVPKRRRLRKLLGMCLGIPGVISDHESPRMGEAVAALANHFDALLLFEFQSIQYCPTGAYRKTLANIEDPPSLKAAMYSRLPVFSFLQRARLFADARCALAYETRVLPRLQRVLLLSEADVTAMRVRWGHANLGHVSYGTRVDEERKLVTWEARQRGAVVFSGNMSHGPNVDAALLFLKTMFPTILRREPSAVFWIVGSHPDARILSAARHFKDSVRITDSVPDIADYLRRATVSVCPIRVKIGVQTKVLEALSVGTPVVTTSAGNSGVAGISGQHLWVEDQPVRFAHRVVDLLNGEGWSRLSRSGRALAANRFTWSGSAARLEKYLAEV